MADNLFIHALLIDRVKLKPRQVTKEFETHIFAKLKQTFEGRCTYHGYIKIDSIEIVKVSCGMVKDITLNGDTIYNVSYYADVCNPVVGSIISVKVVNTNMFGILAEKSVVIANKSYSILDVIVAKNNNNELDKIKVGNSINVEIIGKKYELEDKKITVIGKIVENAKTAGGTMLTIDSVEGDEAEEEVEYDDDISNSGDEEEEKSVKSDEEEPLESEDSFDSEFDEGSDIEDNESLSDKSIGGDLSD